MYNQIQTNYPSAHSYKTLATAVQKMVMREGVVLMEEQTCHRDHRGTIDQIFSFDEMTEEMLRGKKCVLFVC